MNNTIQTIGLVAVMFLFAVAANAKESAVPGTEEFGLTPKQLVQSIEKVEMLISQCMRARGFQYIAVDYRTVRKGMSADKSMPGLSEAEFIDRYGFGVATMYTGCPPQLTKGYSPAKVGLGERNIQLFENLSPADQLAYNRSLLGEFHDATFAVGLETENFSRTGGCTRKAIEQVFTPEQLKASYYNPKDALINKDPRMKAALRQYAARMREAGYDYNHPDEVETDIRDRLAALTENGTIGVEAMPPEKRIALEELRAYEWNVAKLNFDLQVELFDPVEAKIEKEMYARKVN